MRKINLTNDLFALVDDTDYERMNRWNWYVALGEKQSGMQLTPRILHHAADELLEFGHVLLAYDKETDYLTFRNHNRLDFRRENLLLIPIEYARLHGASHANSTSKYKGVSYSTSKKTYIAAVTLDGKKHYIGSSKSEDEAARLFNAYTKNLLGDYAFQNIIGEDNRKPFFDVDKLNLPRQTKHSPKEWRGVYRRETGFQASIKGEFLGTFDTGEDAAYAYNIRAIELYGEHAIVNELPSDFIGGNRKNEFELFGKTYYSIEEVAKAIGVPRTTFHNRLKKMSFVEAIAMGKAEPRIRLEGTSIRALSEQHGVNRQQLARRIKEGIPVQEAIAQLQQTRQSAKKTTH